jgi:7-cyano-7-deazaguanine synthase
MSGGLDSTTLAFRAIADGYIIQPININYGQKNIVEMNAFKNIMGYLRSQKLYQGTFLEPITLDVGSFMKPVIDRWKENRDNGIMKEKTEMEFYTPSRNLLFSSIAAVVGEIIAIDNNFTEIAVGLGIHKHATYDRDYWDIKKSFAKAFDTILALNDCVDINLYAPYANKFKEEIVRDAYKMDVPFELTWTCYDPIITELRPVEEADPDVIYYKAEPCRKCEACYERQLAGDNARVGVSETINKYQCYFTVPREDN